MTEFSFDAESLYRCAQFETLLFFAAFICVAFLPIFATVVAIVRWYQRRHDDSG